MLTGAIVSACLMGAYLASHPERFHLGATLTPAFVVSAIAGAGLLAAVLLRPTVATVVLVSLVYLNLSDVLIRAFGFPSLLQLLGIPLLISAWTHGGRDAVHRLVEEPLTWILAAYVLLHLASTTWADQQHLADVRFEEHAKAFAVYALAVLLASTPGRARLGAWAMLASGAVLGCLGLLQLAMDETTAFAGLARASRGHLYGDVFGLRLSGPLGDPNFFAQILVPLVPLALFLAWYARTRIARTWAVLFLLPILGAIVLTYSRGGAIALGFVVTATLVGRSVRRGRASAVAVLLIGAGVLLVPSTFRERLTTFAQYLPEDAVLVETDSSVEERMVLMGTAWEMLVANPVLGVGSGNYTSSFGEYSERVGSAIRDYEEPDATRYPHNLYLEVGAETGLVGLVTFFLGVLAAFLGLSRARTRLMAVGEVTGSALCLAFQIALAGYLISSLFLHGDFERYLWLLLAMAAALHAASRSSAPPAREGVHGS